ncbi:MAG: PAS domain S-box protein, partial [Bacteroidota bacterium]
TSGLGRTNPRCLLLAPLKVNDEIYGAIEIASFRMLENYELDFVEKLTENIASTISSVKINENTKMLLDETRLYAEQMQAQEEEMRQNMEELAATQEEMERNQFKLESYKENLEREVEKRTAELQDKENDLSDALYQLQGIIDSSTSGIIALDTQYQVKAANAQSIEMISQLFGRQFKVGDNWLEIYENTDRVKYSKQLWDRALGGEDFALEDQYLSAQNGRHWVEVALDPIRNPQNDIIGASMFVRDITERKRSQKDIELTAHILDNSINEVYVFDAETLKFTTVNNRALKNLGYSLEEMKERSPYHIAPRFEKESFQTFISPLQNGEEEILQLETKYYRKDGSTYDVELSLQYFKDEESALFAIIAQDITGRKKNEKQLQEALERFDLATAATNEGIWEMPVRQNDPGNPDNPAWWSKRFMMLLGIEDEANLPPRLLSLINLIHHQDRELFQAALVAHLNDESGNTPFQIECRLQHREEGFIWFFTSGETVRDEAGQPIKFAGSIRNIDRRKKTEEQLSEQHAIMQGIFNASINSIISIDTNEQITFCNPVTEKLFGYSPDELVGKNFRILLAQSHELDIHAQSDQLIETEGRAKDGQSFPIEISLAHTEAFQKDLHILFLRNVSERKEKELLLKESEERLRRISEASTEGIFFHDNGIITDVNRAFTRITGFERNEVIGTAALERLSQESKNLAEASPILDQGGPHEVFFVRKDGHKILLELKARDIAQNGSLLKVVSLRDVKEGKRTEQEQNRLVQILDNFPNGVIYTDSSGNIRYINEAGVQLFGYEVAGEFFDKPLSMLHPQDVLGRMYAEWIPNSIRQGILQVDSVTLMKNGYALPVIQTIIPQMDQNGNVEFITFIFSRKA